jgi:hypothetical protein
MSIHQLDTATKPTTVTLSTQMHYLRYNGQNIREISALLRHAQGCMAGTARDAHSMGNLPIGTVFAVVGSQSLRLTESQFQALVNGL